MSEFKYQHFYPKHFLKKFSSDGLNIWMFNGKEQRQVFYESQCGKDNFYSRTDRRNAEQLMQQGEDFLYQKLEKKEVSEYSQSLTLLLALFFHFRGIKYKNSTNTERIDIMQSIAWDYVCQRMLELPINTMLNEILYKLSLTWVCDIFTVDSGTQQIITSDFPVSILNYKGSVIMVIFPLSKNKIYIAYNKFKIITTNKILNAEDVLNLNKLIAVNSYKNIYSYDKLSQSEMELYRVGIKNFISSGDFFKEENKTKFKPIEITIDTEILKSFSFTKNNNAKLQIISYEKAREIYKNGTFKVDDKRQNLEINKKISIIELYCAIRAREIDHNLELS